MINGFNNKRLSFLETKTENLYLKRQVASLNRFIHGYAASTRDISGIRKGNVMWCPNVVLEVNAGATVPRYREGEYLEVWPRTNAEITMAQEAAASGKARPYPETSPRHPYYKDRPVLVDLKFFNYYE